MPNAVIRMLHVNVLRFVMRPAALINVYLELRGTEVCHHARRFSSRLGTARFGRRCTGAGRVS
jgi:hypothetical protein